MTDHAVRYGAVIDEARIVAARRERGTFVLTSQEGDTWSARSLILATGLHLNQIPLDAATHQAAIEAGVLRYCPICDGYEHIGARIGVVGSDTQGAAEALFLRRYSDDITLIPKSHAELSPSERGDLDRAGIKVIASAACDYSLAEDAMSVTLEDGTVMSFDVVYPALGSRPRTRLPNVLGSSSRQTAVCLPTHRSKRRCQDFIQQEMSLTVWTRSAWPSHMAQSQQQSP
jgi:thioredoxin reductase (NADPH)